MKAVAIAASVGLVVGFAAAWRTKPAEIKTVEKEVVHEVVKRQIERRVVVQRRVAVAPNGARTETSTETVDERETATSDHQASKTSTVATKTSAPGWLISGAYGLTDRFMAGSIQRRLLGPIWLGPQAVIGPSGWGLGVSVSLTF